MLREAIGKSPPGLADVELAASCACYTVHKVGGSARVVVVDVATTTGTIDGRCPINMSTCLASRALAGGGSVGDVICGVSCCRK